MFKIVAIHTYYTKTSHGYEEVNKEFEEFFADDLPSDGWMSETHQVEFEFA